MHKLPLTLNDTQDKLRNKEAGIIPKSHADTWIKGENRIQRSQMSAMAYGVIPFIYYIESNKIRVLILGIVLKIKIALQIIRGDELNRITNHRFLFFFIKIRNNKKIKSSICSIDITTKKYVIHT